MINAKKHGVARRWQDGFTLLELMVVITIILVLLGIAAGRYERSVTHSKEAALKTDLRVMRQAIDQFTLDKQRAPTSLEELVSGEYLRAIPKDPVTNDRNWQLVYEDYVLSADQTGIGITDVHSASDQVSPFEGTPYSSW